MSIQVTLPDALQDKLAELQVDTGAADLKEVLKSAIMLYSATVERRKAGSGLYFRDETGKEVQLFLSN